MGQQNQNVVEIDGRSHERKQVVHEEVPGRFVLVYKGESYVFSKVNDVSISGMGVMFSMELTVGDEVALRYESDDLNVEVNAEVIWVEKINNNVYRTGMQFSNANMDNNVMLFMALREYIDDFGERF